MKTAPHLLSDRIRERRVAIGLSVTAASRLSGIDLTHWGRIERGRGNPALQTLMRIAHTLETTVSDLVEGIDARHLPAGDLPPLTRGELAAAL